MGAFFATTFIFDAPTFSVNAIHESAFAQTGQDWYFNITDPGRSVRMAIPNFEIGTPDANSVSETISTVVWNDMEFASVLLRYNARGSSPRLEFMRFELKKWYSESVTRAPRPQLDGWPTG